MGFLSIILIFLGFFLFFQVLVNFLPRGRGALQVTSNVKAKVLLNGREIGTTPMQPDERYEQGTYTLQLVPEDSSQTYTAKIKIGRGVLTAVDRTFLPGSYASVSILYLEHTNSSNPELFISSIPDGTLVTVDGNDSGVTPLLLKDLSISEHDVELQRGGYAKKTIRVKTVSGYKLIVEAILGTVPSASETLPGQEPSPTPTPSGPILPQVTILETPTGFLRVRADASVNADEIGRVNPGDSLPLLDEQNGWYKIKLSDGKTGWVSSSFAKKAATQ